MIHHGLLFTEMEGLVTVSKYLGSVNPMQQKNQDDKQGVKQQY